MSRRASLPGAEELFRRTGAERAPEQRSNQETSRPVEKSTKLQVAESTATAEAPRKAPKHDEKVTFYCTRDELTALERARIALRSDHAIAADRGRIVRAALEYVLEDFEARGDQSVLVRGLSKP